MVQPHIQKLLQDRYYLRDKEGNLLETIPEEMFGRVAHAVADAEISAKAHWEIKFYDLMKNNKFLPNTPTLINAGKEQGVYAACNVLEVPDSMDGIFDTLKDAAIISKYGGGLGLYFGDLREEGSIVRSTGQTSSGPVSFMEVFDSMCNTVKQGGSRRGAMLAAIPVWHPDIEKFIACKDDGSFSNFNISVAITDEFMDLVERDESYTLYSPITKKPVKAIQARELWNKIVEHAHKTGDPGLIFIDEANRKHPLEQEIKCCNACLHGSTLLMDSNGLKRVEDGDGEFYTAWKTGEKNTVKITLSSGQEIICTPDHLIMTTTGFIEAKDTLGTSIITDTPFRFHDDSELDENYIVAGFLFGDGFICGNGKGYSIKLNPEKEPDVALLLEKYGFNRQDSGAYYKNLLETFGNEWYGTHCEYKTLPKEILANYTKLRGFLRGLFEANGTVSGGRVSYKTSSKKLAQEIQIALNVMNIKSYITTNKAKNIKFSNGTYECKQSYDVNISDMNSIANFGLFIGFISEIKTIKLKAIDRVPGKRKHPKVVSVIPYQSVDVYDFSMNSDVTKWNSANGISVHNCGEQPLLHGESCVLGSINLMEYVEAEDYNGTLVYSFDWDALAEDIPTMVRFLDDIIDASPYPLEEVEKATKASRKIGLGIMGWADCLIKMKIPYDSQEACDLAEKLMQFIYVTADEASVQLGEEKGFFPLADEYPIEGKLDQYRRNATLLTVAPTGTLSRIAGVSSGIEPIFAWKTHHKLVDLEYDETHWAYEERLHFHQPEQNKWAYIPDYMKTANEISPEWHLKMQAAFQKYVDSSISKTINLPNDADIETVEKIYMWAWKNKLKGITIYRDGSKDNQPLNKIKEEAKKEEYKKLTSDPFGFRTLESYKDPRFPVKDEDIINDNFPSIEEQIKKLKKRGPVTVGVTHKVDTGRGKIYITINYSEYHAEPVEVFIRLGHLSTPTEAALAEWSGRLISLLLKYDVPLESIMRQGNKVYADTTFWYNKQSFCSLPKLISHLLSFTFEEAMEMADMDFESMMENGDEYYENNEDVATEEINNASGEFCYNCGTYNMVAEGGCMVCQNCGFERCGG